MNDLKEFILNIPSAPRDRDSKIRAALDGDKIYISLIKKNNKEHFKIYFKQGDKVATKQLKCSDVSNKYILDHASIIVLSDGAKKYLNL